MSTVPEHENPPAHPVDRHRGGDRPVEEIHRQILCVARILAYLNARLGAPLNADELADIRQDTALAAWKKLGPTEDWSTSTPWLFETCKRELHNGLRSKRRRATLHRLIAGADYPSPRRNRDHGLVDEIRNALATLTELERNVVQLKHFRGLTFEEAAAEIHEPSSTVKSRYYRAVTRLGVLLGGREA